jgi:hypothetical protein
MIGAFLWPHFQEQLHADGITGCSIPVPSEQRHSFAAPLLAPFS